MRGISGTFWGRSGTVFSNTTGESISWVAGESIVESWSNETFFVRLNGDCGVGTSTVFG